MASMNHEMYNILVNIEKKVSQLEEHVKTQNGNVARNVLHISEIRKDMDGIKKKIAYMAGFFAAIGSFIGVAIQLAIKYFLG